MINKALYDLYSSKGEKTPEATNEPIAEIDAEMTEGG